MEVRFLDDPLDSGRSSLSEHDLSKAVPLPGQPNVDHALPLSNGYDTVRAIAGCDALVARKAQQERQLPVVTPEMLTSVFEDNVARLAAAQRVGQILNELQKLEGLLDEATLRRGLAISAARTACWGQLDG